MRYSANKSTLPKMKPSSFGYKHWFYNASIYRKQIFSDTLMNAAFFRCLPLRITILYPYQSLMSIWMWFSKERTFVIVAPITFCRTSSDEIYTFKYSFPFETLLYQLFEIELKLPLIGNTLLTILSRIDTHIVRPPNTTIYA